MTEKTTFHIYELDFGTAPLHLSRGKSNTYTDSDNLLHSDGIKSAIFATAIELFGDTRINKAYFDSFKVSSAFPMVKNKYFLPKPAHFGLGIDNPTFRKSLNDVQYLELRFWEKFASGVQKEDALSTTTTLKTPFKSEATQRVWIKHAYEGREQEKGFDYDTLTAEDFNQDSTPFYIEKNFMKEDHKLYFLVNYTEGSDEELFLKEMDGIMRLLGDNGVGLQRGIGNGHFVAKRNTLTLNLPTDSNGQMNLSLYCPDTADTLEQLNLTDSYYKLMKRGGWISTPVSTLRKRSIYMFTEGSVFRTPNAPKGKTEDLRPDIFKEHPIWRDGNAIFLPIQLPEE
jgi:CRISPR-associated protein Csm4